MVVVPVPFVFLLKKGTQAEMSVIGVRSVPYMYIYGTGNTIISVQERKGKNEFI